MKKNVVKLSEDKIDLMEDGCAELEDLLTQEQIDYLEYKKDYIFCDILDAEDRDSGSGKTLRRNLMKHCRENDGDDIGWAAMLVCVQNLSQVEHSENLSAVYDECLEGICECTTYGASLMSSVIDNNYPFVMFNRSKREWSSCFGE